VNICETLLMRLETGDTSHVQYAAIMMIIIFSFSFSFFSYDSRERSHAALRQGVMNGALVLRG
jgi:hypothetical protein